MEPHGPKYHGFRQMGIRANPHLAMVNNPMRGQISRKFPLPDFRLVQDIHRAGIPASSQSLAIASPGSAPPPVSLASRQVPFLRSSKQCPTRPLPPAKPPVGNASQPAKYTWNISAPTAASQPGSLGASCVRRALKFVRSPLKNCVWTQAASSGFLPFVP